MSSFELRNEIINDPAGVGYAVMTNAAVADSLMAKTIDYWIPLSSTEIFEVIDPVEFRALSTADKARIDRILSLGDAIPTEPGSHARAEMIAVFGSASNTIAALATKAKQKRSRAEILGLGNIREGTVAQARST